ncbi:MAG: rhomboid family intramembrane serine protease [Bryobacteraceae bacterium]
MAIGTRSYTRNYSVSGGIPPGVRLLLIANVAVFLVQFFGGRFLGDIFDYLKLIPAAVVKLFFIWQLGTYMFLHAGIMHILFNMLALWWFGTELERVWGTRRFLQFYFFCGIGAGICVVVANYLFGNPAVATVGASGAIYGILLASAVLWPDREMLFYFLFPIKMKYFVMLIGAIAFLNSFNPASPVSDVAHLGGMLFGYAFLRTSTPRSRGVNPVGSLREQYRQWKLARAKKKFQVYMRKQNDRDRYVN